MTTTERYLRQPRVWVKVTRDSVKKTFTFATGYTGEVKGFEVRAWSFAWVPTWADAMQMAATKAADYS
jgi:hypothetical protein